MLKKYKKLRKHNQKQRLGKYFRNKQDWQQISIINEGKSVCNSIDQSHEEMNEIIDKGPTELIQYESYYEPIHIYQHLDRLRKEAKNFKLKKKPMLVWIDKRGQKHKNRFYNSTLGELALILLDEEFDGFITESQFKPVQIRRLFDITKAKVTY